VAAKRKQARHGGKRPGAGRPVEPNPRCKVVAVRLTLAEWQALQTAAYRADLRVSELARARLTEERD
jgi:hypothetical protein